MRTFFLIIALFALSFKFSMAVSQTLNIEINNIKSSQRGVIRIAFFVNEIGYKTEDASFEIRCDKSQIKDRKLNVEVPVKCGIWGISVIDDENNSGKMEYNLLGIPKEGFGFSNYSLKKMRKPLFSDFSFAIGEKEVKNIEVKMKYL